jgi:hypothetical protein
LTDEQITQAKALASQWIAQWVKRKNDWYECIAHSAEILKARLADEHEVLAILSNRSSSDI